MKIYVDMDNVCADYDYGINMLLTHYGLLDNKMTRDENINKIKHLLPDANFYAALPPMPLIEVLKKYEGKYEILSSVGKYKPDLVINQKKAWLNFHLDYTPVVNFVSSGSEKYKYATEDALLIDDRKKCLIPFAHAGGKVLHYKSSKSNDEFIEELLKGVN